MTSIRSRTMLARLGELARIRPGIATSGRAAGARSGDWELRVASVGDITDDVLEVAGLPTARFERSWRVEEHLLRPDDLLVSARTTVYKAALVPPELERAVANATLLVVRPRQDWFGLSAYLWCYLTSSIGRPEVESRMLRSTTLFTLTASALADAPVPLPAPAELRALADLVETGERAYAGELAAARLRRQVVRAFVAQRALAASNHRPRGANATH